MSEEFYAFVKGLCVGTLTVGLGGILIGTTAVPGLVLVAVAVLGFITLRYSQGVNK